MSAQVNYKMFYTFLFYFNSVVENYENTIKVRLMNALEIRLIVT